MLYPQYFYYSEKNSAAEYSRVPQHMLNVGRMIQHKPAWKKISSSVTPKPKSLILADWSAENWDLARIRKVQSKLAELIQNGFTVYLWQNGQLVLCDWVRMLEREFVRQRMTPAYHEELVAAAARQFKLTFDKTHVIDDYQLVLLFGQSPDAPRCIDLADYESTTHDKVKIQKIYDTGYPVPTKYLLSQLNARSQVRLKFDVIKRYRYANSISVVDNVLLNLALSLDGAEESIKQLESLTLSGNGNVWNAVQRAKPPIKYLAFERDIINEEYWSQFNLAHVETLDISYSNITPQAAIGLIQRAPQIKVLKQHMGDAEQIELLDLIKIPGTLTMLETLDLSGKELYSSGYYALHEVLNANPSIKTLRLSYGNYFHDGAKASLLKPLNLPHLEELEVSFAKIISINNGKALKTLINEAPKLKILKLNSYDVDVNDPGCFMQFTHNLNLPLLEELDLTKSTIPFAAFEQLISTAPLIQRLILKECAENWTGKFGKDLNFPQLEELDLSSNPKKETSFVQKIWDLNLSSRGVDDDLCGVLINRNAQKLRVLNLSNCSNVTGLFCTYLERVNFVRLEHIDLTGTNFGFEAFEKLTKLAPMLKRLKLNYASIVYDGLIRVGIRNHLDNRSVHKFTQDLNLSPDLNLSQLEELDLSANHFLMVAKDVTILQFTPALIKLNLADCTSIDNAFRDNLYNLPNLISLDLSRADVSTETLKKMLLNMPNLQKLNLSECHYIYMADLELHRLLGDIDLIGSPGSYWPSQTQKSSQVSQKPSFWSSLFGEKKSSSENSYLPRTTSRHEGKTYMVDTDTTYNPNKEFNLTRIFYAPKGRTHPTPSEYRMSMCDHVSLGRNKAFELQNKSDIHLQPVRLAPEINDVFHLMKPTQFYGKQTFNLDHRWQGIASLSPTDEITHYHSTDHAGMEINYSYRDNQYYIRSTAGSQTITLDFLVQSSNLVKPALNLKIKKIVDEFFTFGIGELKLKNGEDYLNAIMQQKVGSCRHRAVAFKLLMARDYPEIPVRIISNDCHMFTEVKQGNIWFKCELGGYPVKDIIIHESAMPVEKLAGPSLDKLPTITKSKINYISEQQLAFQRCFETWNTDKHLQPDNLHDYIHGVLHHEDKNHLIELSSNSILNMNIAIQTHAKNNSHPVFYIHSPDDLVCSAQFVKRQADGTGVLCDGPGGLLYDFLTTARNNQDNALILIVNYSRFSADDIVRLNGLLDKDRHADGTQLPQNASVIGLIDPDKPGTYKGADFYSRFDTVRKCSSEIIPHVTPVLTAISEDTVLSDRTIINLHHSSAWEAQLMGGWIMKEGVLRFKSGELVHALSLKKPIEIQNPPLDEAFELFWQQAKLNQNISSSDQFVTLNDCMLYSSEGYQWNQLLEQVSWVLSPANNARILNPGRLYRFRDNYQFKNGQLNQAPGLLEAQANRTLAIYVTRSLDDDQWALFLHESQKHNVMLSIACAPGVVLPDAIGQINPAMSPEVVLWDNMPITARTVSICSDNPEATVLKFKADMILDISECNITDLMVRIDGTLRGGSFNFIKTEQAVKKALNAARCVILTGNFSDELLDNLAPLLRNRTHSSAGQLILISKHPIPFMTTLNDIAVSPMIVEESLDTCFTMLSYNANIEPFDPSTSLDVTIEFIEQRKNAVNDKLKEKPYVFLSGLTGVGKSSFIQHDYITSDQQLYQGEENRTWISWACDDSTRKKILFIDEANLSSSDWSVFEGLFYEPRGILIDGQYYPLTHQHKVIFAGNPLNYGDDRRLATLFKRHGNALVFDPLPTAFIYERIIKPVFLNTTITVIQTEKIASELLNVYQFIIARSKNEVLISPRDVQMMALLVSNYHRMHLDASMDELIDAAKFYARNIGMNLLPEVEQEFPAIALPKMQIQVNHSDFLYTESRATLLQMLQDLISIRQHRRNHTSLNDAQCYGGLGGLIIEGEPGIGKSEMVIHYLMSHGFTTCDFYHIPISMEFTAKKQLLMKAFHEGAVVMLDEINSAPMMEQLLNSLLMGKTLDGLRPENPGFTVIGTQNPSTMAGRRVASTALTRRMQTSYLAPYSETEMQAILHHKGLSESSCRELVAAFQVKCLQAKTEHLTPAPVFRDLIKTAEACVEAHKKAIRTEIKEQLNSLGPFHASFFETLKRQTQDGQTPLNSTSKITEHNINWSLRLQMLLTMTETVIVAIAFTAALLAIMAVLTGSILLGIISASIIGATTTAYFYGLFSLPNANPVEELQHGNETVCPIQPMHVSHAFSNLKK